MLVPKGRKSCDRCVNYSPKGTVKPPVTPPVETVEVVGGNTFSGSSQERLDTCHPDLQKLAIGVLQGFDCTVVCGHRTEEAQNLAVAQGNSKVNFPDSTHNGLPSRGIDLAPYIAGKGISWDSSQCYYFAGYVKGIADSLGIAIRCGADWDGDNDIGDQTFNDLVHFELA